MDDYPDCPITKDARATSIVEVGIDLRKLPSYVENFGNFSLAIDIFGYFIALVGMLVVLQTRVLNFHNCKEVNQIVNRTNRKFLQTKEARK